MSDSDTIVNPFFPIILVALAGIIYFGAEVSSRWEQNGKLKITLEQRSKAALQAKQQKAPLEAIARELTELAKTDPAARAIVAKYNIQVQQAPTP